MDQLPIILISALIIIALWHILFGDKKKGYIVVQKIYNEPIRPILRPIKQHFNNSPNKFDKPQANSITTNNNIVPTTPQSLSFEGYQKNLSYKLQETFSGYEVNFHDYYYPNRIGNFTQEQTKFRQLIFNFKDGVTPTETAKLVASCILSNYEKLILENQDKIIFCPIPASSKLRNKNRFEQFCKIICNDLNILNGYYYIEIIYDRQPNRGDMNANRVSNLKYNSSAFKDKTVFLFDDIFTFGKSFSENANIIKAAGAKTIIGIFLGKTYYDG